ncbi:MAG: tRNA (guanosine(46)-N7)-methyltransferase TrmB [bacterium]
MRMRNPKDKEEVLNACEFYYEKEIGFKNENPVHLEVGMGKGDFVIGMAKKYPNINFIGMEKYSAVASIAIKKIKEENLSNVLVLVMDVANSIEELEGKIDLIYLNFSDPWPKDRHAKRRLTHHNQLKVYDSLFKNDCYIKMKTDNEDLFNYSIPSFKEYGYEIVDEIRDLHSTDMDNVMTEYEKKFSSIGTKIKYTYVKK